MREAVLHKAIDEAKRFLTKAEETYNKMILDSSAQYGCKETAAVKRSSMDLTRALAELRKP